MQRFKILILTDHTRHTAENSLYALARAMYQHPWCEQVDVASRWNPLNKPFFEARGGSSLLVNPVGPDFQFHPDGLAFKQQLRIAILEEYDAIWLRLPPPLPRRFLFFLDRYFKDQLVINSPQGIWKTGSKGFLLQFPDLCPPSQLCQRMEDIEEMKEQFPIVLKPLREYGGRGLIKIDGDTVWLGEEQRSFRDWKQEMAGKKLEYLGVKFLGNVAQGDKRIVVVNGTIMGASLRLPPSDSWICNVAMGGTSHAADVTEEEVHLIQAIQPILAQLGIVMYGVDTLVDDQGKRVLSEINTTSVGGLPQIAKMQGKGLIQEAIHRLLNYVKLHNKTIDVSG